MARRLLILATLTAALTFAPAVHAYLKLGTLAGNRLVGIEWTRQPIRYYVTDRDTNGVSASQLAAAVANGFAEWARPADVVLSSQFAGYTGVEPFVDDTCPSSASARARTSTARWAPRRSRSTPRPAPSSNRTSS